MFNSRWPLKPQFLTELVLDKFGSYINSNGHETDLLTDQLR